MLEILKKFGVPSSIAALITTLVLVIPLVFKLDERYAKAEDVEAVSKKIDELAAEVNTLAGIQQTMLTLMASSERRTTAASISSSPTAPIILEPSNAGSATPVQEAPVQAAVQAAPVQAAKPVSRALQYEEVERRLELSQQRITDLKSKK